MHVGIVGELTVTRLLAPLCLYEKEKIVSSLAIWSHHHMLGYVVHQSLHVSYNIWEILTFQFSYCGKISFYVIILVWDIFQCAVHLAAQCGLLILIRVLINILILIRIYLFLMRIY